MKAIGGTTRKWMIAVFCRSAVLRLSVVLLAVAVEKLRANKSF